MSKADADSRDRLVQAVEDAEGVLGNGASGRRLGSLSKLEVSAEAIRSYVRLGYFPVIRKNGKRWFDKEAG